MLLLLVNQCDVRGLALRILTHISYPLVSDHVSVPLNA